MIRRVLLLLLLLPFVLLLFVVPVAGQERNNGNGNGNDVYSIYTLPPFAMTLFSSWTIMGSDLQPTASALQSIGQSYLYDYFHASSLLLENSSASTSASASTASLANMAMHSVELQVSVRMVDSGRIWAEFYGNVAFLVSDETTITRPTSQQMHDLLDAWIAKAFDEQTSLLGLFQQRIIANSMDTNNLVLLNLKTLQVTLDNVQAGPPPPITIPVERVNGQSSSSSSSMLAGGAWSTPEFVLLGTLLFFIASAGVAIYIFINVTERFKYGRDYEFEYIQRQQQQQWDDLQHGRSTTDMPISSSRTIMTESYYDPYDTETPVVARGYDDGVPIANAVDPSSVPDSRFDDKSILKRFLVLFGGSKQREPDLPFVYRDFPRHDGTPCLMYSPTTTATTTEPKQDHEIEIEFDDDNANQSHAHSSDITPHSSHLSEPEPVKMMSMKPGCIIIDNMGDIAVGGTAPLQSSDDVSTSMHSTNSKPQEEQEQQHSVSSTNSLEQFMERLENLYQLKQRQYQQRVAMDRERWETKLLVARQRQPPPRQQQQHQQQLTTTPRTVPTLFRHETPRSTTTKHGGVSIPSTAVVVVTPDSCNNYNNKNDDDDDTPLKSKYSFVPRTPDMTLSPASSSSESSSTTFDTPTQASATTTRGTTMTRIV